MRKGQASTEIIAIAAVMLAMFLTTTLIMAQRNIHANRLYALEKDRLVCDSITAVITGFNSNIGYSETKLGVLEKEAQVRSGGIFIGEASCQYNGTTAKEIADNVFTEDTTGFTLERGKSYKARKLETGVAFCDNAETWC